MNKARDILLAVFVLLTLVLAGQVRDLQYYQWAEGHRIPECPEDSLLLGTGDFGPGGWDYYECGPAVDDFGR